MLCFGAIFYKPLKGIWGQVFFRVSLFFACSNFFLIFMDFFPPCSQFTTSSAPAGKAEMVIFVNSLITTSNSNVLPKKRKSKKSKRYEDDLKDVSDFSSKRPKQHNYDSFDEDPDFLGQIQTETAVSPLKTKTKNSSSPKPKRTTSKKLSTENIQS